MMFGVKANFGLIFYLILLCPFSSAFLSSAGSFFKNAKGTREDQTLLKDAPEFFFCGSSSDCSLIVKKNGDVRKVSSREEADAQKQKVEIWRKFPHGFKGRPSQLLACFVIVIAFFRFEVQMFATL